MSDLTSASPPAPAPRRRRFVLAAAIAAALLLTLAASAAVWLWRTTSGLEFAVAAADRLLPARLQATAVTGSLAEGFEVGELLYEDETVSVRIERLRASLADLQIGRSLAAVRIDLGELGMETLRVQMKPPARPATEPPASIGVPLALHARRLAIGRFDLHAANTAPLLRLRAIDARVEIDPRGYALDDARVEFGPAAAPLRLQFDATLAAARPFALAGRGVLHGSLQAQPLQAQVEAGGSLLDLSLKAQVTRVAQVVPAPGDPPAPHGMIDARIAAFEAPALRELAVDLHHIDPAAWVAGAPRALLEVQAHLRPLPGPGFTLGGPIAARNRMAGPVDRGRIPVGSATATLALDADALRLADLTARLARGSARGRFDLELARPDAWRAELTFANVDPAMLHSRLRPFALDGSARLANADGELSVTGQVRSRAGVPLRAVVDLHAAAARVRIDSAHITLGGGQARLSGELERTGARAVRLAGSVARFDPSLLVAGFDAQLSGTFAVDGALAPQPTGTATFAISESQALGRPLSGRGSLAMIDGRLEIDAELGVRDARLSARGGLGPPGRTLALQLETPQLRDLGLPLAGRLTASALLSGEWTAPAIDARLDASALGLGEHRVETLSASVQYSGGADGEFSVEATAAGHRFRANPVLSLRSVALRAKGRPTRHQIELRAATEEAQPVEATLAGDWRIHDRAARPAWRGELLSATAGRPFDLKLERPAPVATDLASFTLGPADLQLAGARIEQARLHVDSALLSTSGRFSGLRPEALRGNAMATSPLARGTVPHAPVTLRGHWQLRLGAQADGSALIERSDGDIVAAGQAMGLTDLRFAVEIKASRLQAEARMHGTAAGGAEATLRAEVERGDNGWRLVQRRPWRLTADVDMPSVTWTNALLSQAVRANVRVGGALRGAIRVDGTPAEPLARGSFEGSGLRAAWIEQGLRLEGGRLAARLEGETLFVDALHFPGPKPGAPADRRPLLALEREPQAEPGFVTMSGALHLRKRSGVVQVQAVRMPALQRPDRWVVATGGANILFDPRSVQLVGALVADAGYVDFSRPNLPTLSGDVRVLRAAAPPPAGDAPLGVNFDLGIDLGEAFYLRGAGLDTRVEGQLRLRAQGRGAVHAIGALEARDGVFEGFGQRLAIERGRVNFHGALDNPGLDVLALRRGLPVEVGVSVTRTAADPLVRLHAAEPMTEQEMLTWLVLGRPPAATESGEGRLALALAAANFLTGAGDGYGTQFARRVGIDELTLRTGEVGDAATLLPRATVAGLIRGTPATPAGEIVKIGKRLTDDITMSFERAATGTESLVQIIYRLSDRFSVVARAGTENAMNVVYTVAFD